jgi:CelD/BcsL family acetyltransferase involved in cellulose biosynthesis
MDDFLHLMESSKHEKAEFLTPQMEHFFREMAVTLAADGLIRMYFLELDGVRVAAVLCFDCDNSLLMYNSGYDPQLSHLAVGLISKALLVKDAIEQGRACLDFLRGDERYKYDLGAQNSQVYRCTVTRR